MVRVLVNDSINLDMLMDTGSSRTHVPAGIFGNQGGQVYISSLCFENNVCFSNFMALSSESAFTQPNEGYFNGLIGIDLLKNFDLTFDYKSVPSEKDLPPELAKLSYKQATEVHAGADLQSHLKRLVDGLDRLFPEGMVGKELKQKQVDEEPESGELPKTYKNSIGMKTDELCEYVWYDDNSGSRTHAVGQKKSNPWVLCDMHGNVWEWVEDDWHSTYNGAPPDDSRWIDKPRGADRVARGGWFNDALDCRAANRVNLPPSNRSYDIGFRLARSDALDS